MKKIQPVRGTHDLIWDAYNKKSFIENAASDLISLVFGDAGKHTRAAVSTNSLPLGVSVEIDAIFELN